MAAPVLQFKRGNAGLAGTVPALRPGEPALSLNNFDLFVGTDNSVANNKFFGSHRYWTRENGSTALSLNLVDKDGSNKISIKSPDTLSGSGTYTLPDTSTIVNGYFLRVATDGTLSWSNDLDSAGATFVNSTLTGVTTITGAVNATAAQINAGILTATDFYIDATRVLYDDGAGIALAGIQTIDATTKSTLETILAFDPNNFTALNVSGISTFNGFVDANAGADISGQTELDGLNVSVAATFATATVSDLTSGRVVLAGTSGKLQDSANLTFSAGGLTVGSGGINVTGVSTFSTNVVVGGDIRVNGNDIQASDGATNITLTSNTLTAFAGDIRVNGNDIQASDGNVNITMTSNTLTEVKGDLQVTGNDIKSSTGANVLTLSANNASFANDLTVTGNLYINGSTTQVNTTTLNVKDTLVDLGLIDTGGGVLGVPTSDLNKDIGILLNYYTSSAKKAAVYWDDSTSRIAIAADVTESSGVLTAAAFAPIEIKELYVTDTAGTAEAVITYNGSTSQRELQNIVLDCGTF